MMGSFDQYKSEDTQTDIGLQDSDKESIAQYAQAQETVDDPLEIVAITTAIANKFEEIRLFNADRGMMSYGMNNILLLDEKAGSRKMKIINRNGEQIFYFEIKKSGALKSLGVKWEYIFSEKQADGSSIDMNIYITKKGKCKIRYGKGKDKIIFGDSVLTTLESVLSTLTKLQKHIENNEHMVLDSLYHNILDGIGPSGKINTTGEVESIDADKKSMNDDLNDIISNTGEITCEDFIINHKELFKKLYIQYGTVGDTYRGKDETLQLLQEFLSRTMGEVRVTVNTKRITLAPDQIGTVIKNIKSMHARNINKKFQSTYIKRKKNDIGRATKGGLTLDHGRLSVVGDSGDSDVALDKRFHIDAPGVKDHYDYHIGPGGLIVPAFAGDFTLKKDMEMALLQVLKSFALDGNFNDCFEVE